VTVTDAEQLLRAAVGVIWKADATLQGLCGGTVRVVDRNSPAPAITLPALATEVVTLDRATGEAELRVTALANGADAAEKCRALLEAATAALTTTALSGQGVDGVARAGTRESIQDAGDVRDFMFFDGGETFRQADERVPVLLFAY